jgi:hypothetical protein
MNVIQEIRLHVVDGLAGVMTRERMLLEFPETASLSIKMDNSLLRFLKDVSLGSTFLKLELRCASFQH